MRPSLLSAVLAVLMALPPFPARAADDSAGTAEPMVNFSFDQVEIRLLVQLVGEMTGRRFVVDDSVTGKVTVISPPRIPMDEAYPLLVSVLESSGYTISERDGTFRVIPLPERKLARGAVQLGGETGAADGLVTKVINVQNVSAVELRKILEPFVRGGKDGAIAAFGLTNHLLITDTAENIRELEKIIRELDKPGAASVMEVVQLQHATADDMARQLIAAMAGAASAGDRIGRHMQQAVEGTASLPTDAVVVPSPRSNSLLLVGNPVQIAKLREMVARLDVESPSGYGRMNALFLKYLTAEEAAKNLNALLAKTTEKDQRSSIAIEHNTANNALIIDASPQDFEVVKKLVAQLDQIPQQVLVEILIAEVTEGKALDLGVRLSTVETPDNDGETFLGSSRPSASDSVMEAIAQGILPQGLAVGVADGLTTDAAGNVIPRIPVLVEALARNRDVKILSRVPLWAQNNTEASVSVVENIPLLRSTIEGGSGASRDVIQNIDRVDVGVKLKVTPHVNPDREVLLKLNPSIEAVVDEGSSETQFTPTIAKREVSTTVTVPDRATVVITGLMREDMVNDVYKVPLLGDIPLIGFFFRSKTERKTRTNLLIFVTPHIVTDMAAAIELRDRLKEKTGIEAESALLPSEPVGR